MAGPIQIYLDEGTKLNIKQLHEGQTFELNEDTRVLFLDKAFDSDLDSHRAGRVGKFRSWGIVDGWRCVAGPSNTVARHREIAKMNPLLPTGDEVVVIRDARGQHTGQRGKLDEYLTSDRSEIRVRFSDGSTVRARHWVAAADRPDTRVAAQFSTGVPPLDPYWIKRIEEAAAQGIQEHGWCTEVWEAVDTIFQPLGISRYRVVDAEQHGRFAVSNRGDEIAWFNEKDSADSFAELMNEKEERTR